MRCLLSLAYNLVPFVIILLLVVLVAKKQRRAAEELYHKSHRNQELMIELLREIRDALKK